MSEMDFQREVLSRLGQIEATVKGLQAEFDGWRNQLEERCHGRIKNSELQWDRYRELKKRIETLEQEEHKRHGGMVVIGALITAAGALGGLIVKLWNSQ